jgi:hypothetical protein
MRNRRRAARSFPIPPLLFLAQCTLMVHARFPRQARRIALTNYLIVTLDDETERFCRGFGGVPSLRLELPVPSAQQNSRGANMISTLKYGLLQQVRPDSETAYFELISPAPRPRPPPLPSDRHPWPAFKECQYDLYTQIRAPQTGETEVLRIRHLRPPPHTQFLIKALSSRRGQTHLLLLGSSLLLASACGCTHPMPSSSRRRRCCCASRS